MIRNPDELTVAIKYAVNRRAIVFSHIVLAVAISAHTLLWPEYAAYEKYMSVGFSIILILLIFFRFFDLARINNHPLVYTVIYELMAFFGIMLLTEARTPHVLTPMIPLLISNLYFGAKGVYATVAVFIAASVGKYIILSQEATFGKEDTIDIVIGVLLFIAIASLFVSLQKVYDWDRTRLKSILREANIGQKRLRTLINSMTESVLVLDKNSVIKLYNAAALALFDTNTSLEGKRPGDFAKFEDEKGQTVTLDALLPQSNNPVTRTDIRLCYGKEDFASLSITITPLRASFGQGDTYEGFIITMRDITREKSLEEERNEFISVISHELRTPVTVTEASISNALMVNEKQGGNDAVKKTLETAHDQSVFLANMLNDLSTFARAEKGLLELDLEEISPQELIEHLVNDYHNEAEVKGMHLASNVHDVPDTIVSNRLYIREILQNFITNAIKYSDSGTITISALNLENGGIKFSVSDEGIGISKTDQKKVFDKFFRSEDYRTRSRNGTGLGLYIVRKLAKLLHATFELESEVGKGSTFSLLVPDLRELRDKSHAHQMEVKASEANAGDVVTPSSVISTDVVTEITSGTIVPMPEDDASLDKPESLNFSSYTIENSSEDPSVDKSQSYQESDTTTPTSAQASPTESDSTESVLTPGASGRNDDQNNHTPYRKNAQDLHNKHLQKQR